MRVSGFTLVELMVAVAILAVISAVAMPFYTQYSLRTFRSEGQADLMACGQAMERFAAVNFTYQNAADTDADGIGDADAGAIADAVCSPDSVAQGRYAITVNGTAVGFVLTATPAGRMAGDGLMTFDGAGNRAWDENNDGDTTDAGEQDWAY
ncbi:MAG: prepilin-type N-terminal cleavage/methylation domain-containing protein [Gammaproteobacteria bacterium]|nr:prepilin-type N-terminal cleavage/methylation domain-containing protein [Gammaproteobacteria bacterium]